MKVKIEIRSVMRYGRVVEMTEERFNALNDALQSSDRDADKSAEEDIVDMIDFASDFIDDDYHEVETFEKAN